MTNLMVRVHFLAQRLCRRFATALALLLLPALAQALPVGAATCFGRMFNPVTDICWQCLFPISIGPASFTLGQEDAGWNNPAPICVCPKSTPPFLRVGLPMGFWEPARTTEVTRTPFCFPTLGGFYMPAPGAAPWGGRDARASSSMVSRTSFYQVHHFATPWLALLGVITNALCVDTGGYDLAYITEYDPTWHEDELALILAPESVLFANIVATAACTADCIKASTGFGFRELFWCSGCNGVTYPLNGNNQVHQGGIQASALLTHRMLAKQHRQMTAWQTWGPAAQCMVHPNPLMDKAGYKTQVVYPIPNTFGTDGTGPFRCCQPLGRTTQIYGAGREFPIRGEDFAYLIWRKRNCCVGTP